MGLGLRYSGLWRLFGRLRRKCRRWSEDFCFYQDLPDYTINSPFHFRIYPSIQLDECPRMSLRQSINPDIDTK